jgi:hypothetical protein
MPFYLQDKKQKIFAKHQNNFIKSAYCYPFNMRDLRNNRPISIGNPHINTDNDLEF